MSVLAGFIVVSLRHGTVTMRKGQGLPPSQSVEPTGSEVRRGDAKNKARAGSRYSVARVTSLFARQTHGQTQLSATQKWREGKRLGNIEHGNGNVAKNEGQRCIFGPLTGFCPNKLLVRCGATLLGRAAGALYHRQIYSEARRAEGKEEARCRRGREGERERERGREKASVLVT